MIDKKVGPILSDEEFYSSLFPFVFYGKHGYKKAFFDYIRNNLDRSKYFLAIKKSKILSSVTIWMVLESIMLNETS